MNGGAGDAAGLPDLGGRHGVGLDRRFEAVDDDDRLDVTHRVGELAGIGDVVDAVVAAHRVTQFRVEGPLLGLTDPNDGGPNTGQRKHKTALVRREGRLDENDVHACDPMPALAGWGGSAAGPAPGPPAPGRPHP